MQEQAGRGASAPQPRRRLRSGQWKTMRVTDFAKIAALRDYLHAVGSSLNIFDCMSPYSCPP